MSAHDMLETELAAAHLLAQHMAACELIAQLRTLVRLAFDDVPDEDGFARCRRLYPHIPEELRETLREVLA